MPLFNKSRKNDDTVPEGESAKILLESCSLELDAIRKELQLGEYNPALENVSHKVSRIESSLNRLDAFVGVEGQRRRVIDAKRTVYESCGMLETDCKGIVRHADAVSASIFQVSVSRLIDTSVNTWLHLENENIKGLFSDGETSATFYADINSPSKDCAVVTVESLPDGFNWLIEYNKDIAKAVRAMWEAEQRFCKLFRQMSDLVCIVSLENNEVLSVNPAFIQRSEYSLREILTNPVALESLLKIPSGNDTLKMLSQNYGTINDLEITFKSRTGNTYKGMLNSDAVDFGGGPCIIHMLKLETPIDIQENPWKKQSRDQEDRVKGRTVELLQTVAQMKQEIIERRRTEQRLKEERDFNRTLLHTIGAIIIVLDKNARIIRLNPAGERATGFYISEIRGKRPWEIFADEESSEEFKEKIAILQSEGKCDDFEMIWVGKSGEERVIYWTNRLLKSEAPGGPEYIIMSGVDVTEQRVLTKELQHAEKMAMIGRVAAGIAHEIGNPLASMSARLQRMKLKKSPEFFDESIKLLSEQITRMSRIIRGITTFSRPPTTRWVRCMLKNILEDILKILSLDNRGKNVEFKLDVSPFIPITYAAKDQLEQVFLNIGLNALDAMPEGGTLDVKAAVSETDIIVSFKDTGVGMSDEVRKRLFKPFFTTKPEGVGTGLGLALSAEYIEEHGGKIEVESAPGEGAEFRLLLPLLSSPPDDV